jgi:hypothetical protein
MKQMLFALTSWLLSNFAKKVLLGAGVTLVSGAVINAILATYINKAISASSSIDPTYLGLLSISGLDHAISIIIGALVARATILAANVSIKKRDALTRTARLSCVRVGVSRWRKNMLTLITGKPGSFKTAKTASLAIQYLKEGRPVYTNIDEFDYDGVQKLPENNDWRQTLDGSVIIYDEAQQFDFFNIKDVKNYHQMHVLRN